MALFFIFEDILGLESAQRSQRRLREEALIKEISNAEFISNYRLNRHLFVCAEITPFLPQKKNLRGIDPTTKILTALAFYARGKYQGAVGLSMDGPMAQQSVSKCIREVTDALNSPSVINKFIKFPQNRQERSFIKEGFYEMYGVPGICGCIDCTHIAIVRPHNNENHNLNRMHFHSINCQVICDVHCRILNVCAAFGGATNDSFVWKNHEIKEHLERLTNSNDEPAMLLGYSGYPLRKYLMIPVGGAPDDSPEGHYNAVHKRMRSTIERTFGVLKGRWRCLLAARHLHYSPEMAAKIVIACCVLHNMCINAGLDPVELSQEELHAEIQLQPPQDHSTTEPSLEQGEKARNALIQLLNRNKVFL